MTVTARVKICGITSLQDALAAAKAGAWAVGFIFYQKSPRYILPEKARKIIAQLPPFVTPVAVFVNEKMSTVKRISAACGIQTIQLHGDESPSFCRQFRNFKVIKAFRIHEDFDFRKISHYPVQAILLDSYQKSRYGGTGKTFDWGLIKQFKNNQIPLILSGGIKDSNIKLIYEKYHPFAVDVSSGVEISPGKKSRILLTRFFSKIQEIA